MPSEEDEHAHSRAGTDVSTQAEARELLSALVQERDRTEARRRVLTERIRGLLTVAHDLGVSWSELASLAGYKSAETARVQALRHEANHPANSLSIREAADHYGVSRQTIHDWIKAGKIELAVDRPRGRRVYLPEGSPPVP